MSFDVDDARRRLARTLRLRDLHTLATVAEQGSMAKAAARLSITQPAVSQAIADLEAFVGARLLDRGPLGASLTVFGEALIARAGAAFDSLDLGLRDVAFLAEPGAGTVAVAGDMSFIAGGFMAEIISRLRERHPRLEVQAIETTTRTAMPDFRELRAREVDLMFGRLSKSENDEELEIETLMEDELRVVVGAGHRLAGRAEIAPEDLAGEAWILASTDNLARSMVEGLFRAAGLAPPRPAVTTYSMHLRLQLLAGGRYMTVMPETALARNAERWDLRALPVTFARRLPIAAVKLRHRTPTPAAEVFLAMARAVVKGTPAGGA